MKFEEDLKITTMYSAEGETVEFRSVLYPTGNVEFWMIRIEETMKESLRLIIKDALEAYPNVCCNFLTFKSLRFVFKNTFQHFYIEFISVE